MVEVVQEKKEHALPESAAQPAKCGVAALEVVVQVHHEGEVAGFALIANIAFLVMALELMPTLVAVKTEQLVETDGQAVAELDGHKGLHFFLKLAGQLFAGVENSVVVANIRPHLAASGGVHLGQLEAIFFAKRYSFQAFRAGHEVFDGENRINYLLKFHSVK